MKLIFVDSLHWIAHANPKDQWHQTAREVESNLSPVHFLTTEVVLIEFLNHFCGYGSTMRQIAVHTVQKILQNPMVEVVPLTHELFIAGLQLYGERLDKGYSLTDCISMIVMQEYGLTEVLTHVSEAFRRNRHFSQEGFQVLL